MSPANEKAPTAATVEALSVNNPNQKGINMSDSKAVQASSQPVFSFGDHEVRVVVRDGEPWFVASDVCGALDYKNTSKAIGDHLDDDEKGLTTGYTLGGDQKLTVISESGLYALVLRSRKPEARKFAKWVTSEVLPAIRKTGQYKAIPAAGPLTIEMREKVKAMVVQKLDAQQYNAAITLLAKMQVNWEVVDEEPAAPVRYHFPLATADVHDRFCANTWLTPERLTDPKNKAPELDLIQALERDGHDVTGVKVRILAMRDAMEQVKEMREALMVVGTLAKRIHDFADVAREMRGKNVLFGCRPDPSSAIDRQVFRDQLGVA